MFVHQRSNMYFLLNWNFNLILYLETVPVDPVKNWRQPGGPPRSSDPHAYWVTWNFIKILQAAFGHADPESAKKTDNLAVFFALLGSAPAKVACRT